MCIAGAHMVSTEAREEKTKKAIRPDLLRRTVTTDCRAPPPHVEDQGTAHQNESEAGARIHALAKGTSEVSKWHAAYHSGADVTTYRRARL